MEGDACIVLSNLFSLVYRRLPQPHYITASAMIIQYQSYHMLKLYKEVTIK